MRIFNLLSVNGEGKRRADNWICLSIIFLVAAAIMLPMAFMGIPDGYDLTQHIRFAAAYHDSILAGDFVPSWAANDNYGFGSIGIRYYPPLAYYVLAATKMLTGNWYDSFWINSFGWMFLGCAGVYYWSKEWLSGYHAAFAAVIYALAPYHTFQIYQAVLFAEFAAAGVLPFCFLFLTRICRRQRWTDAVLFGISFALLILTHIPSTIIASPCMAIYVVLLLDRSRFVKVAVRLGSAFILTMLVTAFHLSKLLAEQNWVLHNSPQYYSNGYYDFNRYFFPILYSSPETYAQKLLWQLDLIVALTFLLFLPLAAYLVFRRTSNIKNKFDLRITRALLPTGLFSLFMLTIISLPIWNYVPMLQKIQFPWRWLLVASLFGSVSFALIIQFFISSNKKINRVAMYSVTLFVLLIAFVNITQSIIPSVPLSRNAFQQKIDEMNNNVGCECWWPVWVKSAAFDNRNNLNASSRKINPILLGSENREFAVDAGEGKQIRVATFYHPFWKATVNGDQVPVERDENGVILISLPDKASKVRLFFQEPVLVTVGSIISLVTWFILISIFAAFALGKLRQKWSPELTTFQNVTL